MKKVYVKNVYGVSQNSSGMIGTVKAKTKKIAFKKSHLLPMYDYGQKTSVWKYFEYK